jgi:PAS domain S-box-containing protein
MDYKTRYNELNDRIKALEEEHANIKDIEKTVRESESLLRRLIEGLEDNYIIYSGTLDRTILYISPGIKRLVSVDEKDLIGRKWDEVLKPSPETLETIIQMDRILESGSAPSPHEIALYDLSGKQRIYEVQMRPVFNNEGKTIAIDGIGRDITEHRRYEKEREKFISELKEALSKVKTLSGLLPICASCKKIRDDRGYWNQIEAYIRDHSEAEFSHSICPECVNELYPDLDIYD